MSRPERSPNPSKLLSSDLPEDLKAMASARFFSSLVANARWVVALGVLGVVALMLPLPTLFKDTRSDAFLPADHASLLQRDRVKEIFGIGESLAIAVITEREDGVFNEEVLNLVSKLTTELEQVPGVDPDRIVSLATEEDIRASAEGVEIEPLFDAASPQAMNPEVARRVRDAVERMPAWQGSLVGRNGQGTLIVAELLHGVNGDDVYQTLIERVEQTAVAPTEQIHVAGDGALTGHLSSYIDTDAQRLNPLAALVVALVLLIAHRTRRGVLLPQFLTLATLAGAMGLMAAMGIPFFLITNGMLVLLIGISVADGLHIMGQYYEEIAMRPEANEKELVIRTMVAMWRPVTITSVTDICGFGALALASYMPPMRWFGFFAGVGVLVAWIYSMTVIPAILSLLKPQLSRAFRAEVKAMGSGENSATEALETDRWGRFSGWIGTLVTAKPGTVLVTGTVIVLVGLFAATQIQIDEETVKYFHEDEPIRRADTAINGTFDGTHYVDVVLEAGTPEAFYEPESLEVVQKVTNYLEQDPRVQGVTSILDVVKQVHRSLEGGEDEAYRIPTDPDLVAQSLLMYEMSSDPITLGRYLDSSAERVHLRARLKSSRFSRVEPLMVGLEEYLEKEVRPMGWAAAITGRVEIIYQWVSKLRSTHFRSLAVALLAVWLVVCFCFRSPLLGTLAVIPVMVGVMLVYSVMGIFGIWLGVGTTMFAAIAIGTAVDFAVHTIDRIQSEATRQGSVETAVVQFFGTTGRALLFNVTAMVLGFSMLTLSQVPSLVQFGGLVSVAVAASFLASVTLIPAALLYFQPEVLNTTGSSEAKSPAKRLTVTGVDGFLGRVVSSLGLVVAIAIPLMLTLPEPVSAQSVEGMSGLEVAQKINDRAEGDRVDQAFVLRLKSRSGAERERTARVLREDAPDGTRRRVLIYEKPARFRNTGLLTWDYNDKADDQWLYLPATRKVRRISSANRGDAFLGTDFSYEEMKNGTRVALEDHTWEAAGRESDEISGCQNCLVVEAKPATPALARELGYSRMKLWVDSAFWLASRADYWDSQGNLMKTVYTTEIREVDGFKTPHRYEAVNHKTGNRSVLEVTRFEHPEDIPDEVFSQQALRRGL